MIIFVKCMHWCRLVKSHLSGKPSNSSFSLTDNLCMPNPCQNGGICLLLPPNDFACDCPPGTLPPTCALRKLDSPLFISLVICIFAFSPHLFLVNMHRQVFRFHVLGVWTFMYVCMYVSCMRACMCVCIVCMYACMYMCVCMYVHAACEQPTNLHQVTDGDWS